MASSVRGACFPFDTGRCTACAQRSSRRLLLIRGHKALVATTTAFDHGQHPECNDDIAIICWDEKCENHIGSVLAGDWDFDWLSSADVDAEFADALTFRLIVQRLPGPTPNVKELRAFRDNVTRKLAPTIARALAVALAASHRTYTSQACAKPATVGPQGMALIDGYVANRLLPLNPNGQEPRETSLEGSFAAHPVPSDEPEPRSHFGQASSSVLASPSPPSLPEAERAGSAVPLQLRHETGADKCAAALPVTKPAAEPAAEAATALLAFDSLESRRRRRRGTGRGSLANAGRQGLPAEPVAAAPVTMMTTTTDRQLPPGW